MIDLKPEILQALRGDTELVSLLGGAKVWPEASPDSTALPYITFFEIVNIPTRYADNKAYNSEIHFHIDIWSKGNTAPVAIAVNRVMESINFDRTSASDQYEDDTNTYHKVLRYRTNRMIKE